MVFWYCKWCPLNYLITLGVGQEERDGVQRHPTLHILSCHPLFSHPPYILFVKIKSIVAAGWCCILRMNDYRLQPAETCQI